MSMNIFFNTTTAETCSKAEYFLNLTTPRDAEDILYGPTDRFLMTVLIPIISLIGVIGNGAFLYMSFVVPELRISVTTSYLANLAVCDLLFLLSVNVWFVIIFLNTQVNIEFLLYSSIECAISTVSVNWWYYTSLGLITLITVERYFAVCHPIKHMNMKSQPGRVSKLLAAIWILALLVTFTQVPQSWKFITYCVVWPDMKKFETFPNTIRDCEPLSVVYDIYGSVLVVVTMLVTLLINTVLFIRIIHELRKTRNLGKTSSVDKVRNQVTRTLILNGIIFFICQLPYRVWILDDVLDLTGQIDLIGFELESPVLTIGRAFLILNSIINPFLYVFTCRHYRQAVLKAFCGNRCLGPEAITDDITVSRGFVRKARWTTSNSTNSTAL
ncbi:somatostatin receptor type 5-like [Amphiura filiformis]|uniref:somatostatin receptor type 5-like n=1 Tax=Amphiura filiformis TaxID=82378 RepID=UPI003B21D883